MSSVSARQTRRQPRKTPLVRSSRESIRQEASRIDRVSHLRRVIEIMPGAWAALNRNRQIVLANRSFAALFDLSEDSLLTGLRLGEVLGCRLADPRAGGCGNVVGCSSCIADCAIDNALEGENDQVEVTLKVADGKQTVLRSYHLTTHEREISIGKYVLVSLIELKSATFIEV
ncbi:MAG: PAS domain-containing protein [Verrucomicrobiota bacterium]